MVEGHEITLGKDPVAGRLTLKQPAPTLLLHITDILGQEKVIDLGKQPAGPVNFTLDPAAAKLQPGQYQLSAVSGSGEELIPLEVAGKVNNVRISPQGGAPQLNITGLGEVHTAKSHNSGPSPHGQYHPINPSYLYGNML